MTSHSHSHSHSHARSHASTESEGPTYDAVVIGGGAAGLSAAIALGRSRRSVLVLDAGEPRNAPATGVHNLLGHEGIAPGELLERGRSEAAQYGVQVRTARVGDVRRTSAEDAPPAFAVTTDDGHETTARRIVVATGLVDRLPDLPGLAEHWGTRVLHCPFCHGWEVRDQAVAVLGTGPMAAHQAYLFQALTDDLVLVLADGVEVTDDDRAQLVALGVRVVTDAPVAVESEAGRLVGVRLASGALLERDAVVVAPQFHARADFLTGLGLEAQDVLMGDHVVGTAVPADPTGTTAVPGVVVAGNVTDVTGQVGASAASGVRAGALVHSTLVQEEAVAARVAVDELRRSFFERASWEERYAERDAVWSGHPNAQLVAETAGLTPGRAVDIGSGEGADAIWLATQGWEVTGLEFSAVARERAAAHAAAAGVDGRTGWRDADLREWEPGDERWDLVTSHFFHQPDGGMLEVVRRLAGAVAPGGTLLVVGHEPDDLATGVRLGVRDWMFVAGDLLPALDASPGGPWEIEVCESRARLQALPDGAGTVEVTDAVLRARRR